MPKTKGDFFFWSDWDADPELRNCSYAAQGLWMRMLCIAARHDPIGYVAVNRVGLDEDAIARMTGGAPLEVRSLIGELDRNGVFSRDRHGTIYNRRMVRDAKKRKIARENGKKGGNPNLSKTTGIPPPDNPPVNPGVKAGDNLIPIPKPESNDHHRVLRSGERGPTPNDVFERLVAAAKGHLDRTSVAIENIAPILALMAAGCDLERHILPTIREKVAKLGRPLRTWGASWLHTEIVAMRDRDRKINGAHVGERTIYLSADMREVPESNARKMIMRFYANGSWPFHAGLKPDDPEFGAKDLLPERERARA